MGELTPEQIHYCLTHPEWALRELDRTEAEGSLKSFVKLFWFLLEPRSRPFVEGWLIDAMCEHLEAVSSGQIRKLLINVPPGCSKSSLVNVYFPAWEWGPRDMAWKRYISASYSPSLTVRDNRKCRSIITSPLYRAMWGHRFSLMGDQNAVEKYENDKTGWRVATSVGGLGTGEKADDVLIDDPHKVKEAESDTKREGVVQWFAESMMTRFNDPDKGVSVVVMQRVNERDVSGHIISKELGYDHLCVPMRYESDHPLKSHTSIGFVDPRTVDGELMWPERYPARVVDDLERDIGSWGGSYAIAGQHQQRPAPRGGGMFQRKDFQIVAETEQTGWVVRGWDLAGTKSLVAAYTAGVRMRMTAGPLGKRRLIIEDVRRIRGTPHEVEALILATAESDGHAVSISIPQDPGQAGVHQKVAMASLLHGFDVHFSPESGSKEDRAKPFASQVESGNVSMARAPWNDAFTSEAIVFPAGTYKDQIDAATRAYGRLLQITARRMHGFAAPEVIA